MRILMVTPMPPQAEAPGAIPLVLYAQLRGLRARNHRVSVATVAGKEPGEQQALERLRQEGHDVYAAVPGDTPGFPGWVHRWGRRWRLASTWLRGRHPWRSIWFWEPDLQRILDDQLRSEQYDLVIVEDNATGMYRYETEAPLIFTEHEVRRPRPLSLRVPDGKSRTLGALARHSLQELDWARWPRYQRRTWQKFDRIQVFTREDADAVREIAPEVADRVQVNPFGVVLPSKLDPGKVEPMRLLFVGNYTHAPNVDAALWLGREIMPLLRSRCPGVQLSLVGTYPPDEVKALQGADIEVTGAVPEIEPYMERAAVVLAPVRIGGGMRMKVLLSMAMGKAVVTTPRGAQGFELGAEPPPLSISNSATAFASAVAELLSSPEKRQRQGEEARDYVALYYSPEAYASRVEALYEEMQTGGKQVEPQEVGMLPV